MNSSLQLSCFIHDFDWHQLFCLVAIWPYYQKFVHFKTCFVMTEICYQFRSLKGVQVNLCQNLFFFAEHGENMLCTKIVLNVRNQHVLPRFEIGIFMFWTCNSMNNLSSYCGLVGAKIRPSDKDLPEAILQFQDFFVK